MSNRVIHVFYMTVLSGIMKFRVPDSQSFPKYPDFGKDNQDSQHLTMKHYGSSLFIFPKDCSQMEPLTKIDSQHYRPSRF